MISAVILTKNEENNIVDCLDSVSWCDEILIVDDFSTDRTLEVVRNYGPRVKVFQRRLENDFSSQRNFGLTKSRNDWVLFIDADERLSNSLKGEIQDLLEDKNIKENGFYIKREDVIWGKNLKHGETGNIRLLRLGRKNKGKWSGKVHEVWNMEGGKGNLKNFLYHYPHPTIEEFLREINGYTDLRARELHEKGVTVKPWQIVVYPLAKFKLNFILKLGFLDGVEGLVFAIMMSLHSFLVRGKLWLLWQKK